MWNLKLISTWNLIRIHCERGLRVFSFANARSHAREKRFGKFSFPGTFLERGTWKTHSAYFPICTRMIEYLGLMVFRDYRTRHRCRGAYRICIPNYCIMQCEVYERLSRGRWTKVDFHNVWLNGIRKVESFWFENECLFIYVHWQLLRFGKS